MKKVKIGDFLHRIKRPITLNQNDEYSLVTIKMHHKGVILRGLKKGADIKSKMYHVREGDFILSGIDARNGAFGIVPQELDGAIVTNDFWYFKLDEDIIDKHFFLELTSTSWFDEICRLGSDGTTQRIRLQKDKFFNQEINLPPLEEQQDFISKFISFKTINSNITNEIETQQTLLKKLRQSILQEAIEGKLTVSWREQNPDVESASVLLEKIKIEKEKLINEKKIKKQKPLPIINEDEIPFDIPDGWEWCRLKNMGEITGGGTPSKHIKGFWNGDIPWISPKDMKSEYINDSELKITQLGVEKSSAKLIEKNSLLLVGRSGILKHKLPVAINLVPCTVNQDMKVLIPFKPLPIRYLQIMMMSMEKIILKDLVKFGMTVHSLKYSEFEIYPFPVPPLKEQKEIVKKIENLFNICDELETQIDSSKVNSEMLMQAVLKEAFEK